MFKKPNKIKILLTLLALCVVVSLGFRYYAQGIVRYPSVASLGTGDIKTSHIQDGTILDEDVNASAAILSDKITYSGDTATSTQEWGHILDYIASIATTSDNFIYADGSGWVACSGAICRTLLGLGTLSTQNSTNTSITGGSITGITDLTTADGGTGQSWNAVAQGNIPYFSATGTAAVLAPGTSGYENPRCSR